MGNLFGLVGEKLGHSYSPKIHEKILLEINIKGSYGLLEIKRENISKAISSLKVLGYKGVNITIPYKTELMNYIDDLSDEAKKIGAINVISIDENGLAKGYNSDYYGFGMMLENHNVKISNENILVLGTGGASKAIVQYFEDNNANNIVLCARNLEKSKKVYKDYQVINYEEINTLNNFSTVVNCTPVGMYPNVEETPIDKNNLNKFQTAIDIIYNPEETIFLKDAKNLGLKTIGGIDMLVSQAVKSQEIWNNITISNDITDKIIKSMR